MSGTTKRINMRITLKTDQITLKGSGKGVKKRSRFIQSREIKKLYPRE